MRNRGGSAAVIDSVSIAGGSAHYPAPRLLAVRSGRFTRYGCTSLGGFGWTGSASALAGCVLQPLRPAAGLAISASAGATDRPHAQALVMELAPPAAGNCWVLGAVPGN